MYFIFQQAIHIMEQALNQFGTYEEFEEQTGGRILSRSQIIGLVKRYLKKEDLESEIQVTVHLVVLDMRKRAREREKKDSNSRSVVCHNRNTLVSPSVLLELKRTIVLKVCF